MTMEARTHLRLLEPRIALAHCMTLFSPFQRQEVLILLDKIFQLWLERLPTSITGFRTWILSKMSLLWVEPQQHWKTMEECIHLRLPDPRTGLAPYKMLFFPFTGLRTRL